MYPPAEFVDVTAVELRRGIHHQERFFPGTFVFTGLSVLCRSSYSEINGQRISHTHLFAALFARFPFGRSCDDAPRLFRECLARRLKYLDIAYRAVLFDDERQYDTPLFPVPECLGGVFYVFLHPCAKSVEVTVSRVAALLHREQGHGLGDQERLVVLRFPGFADRFVVCLSLCCGFSMLLAGVLRSGGQGRITFGRYDYHAVAGFLPVGRYGGLVFEYRYVFDAVRIELVYEIGGHLDPVDHPERFADLGRKHRCPRGFGFQRDPGKLTGCLSDLQQVGFATDVGDCEY